jgi:hypothetical protein
MLDGEPGVTPVDSPSTSVEPLESSNPPALAASSGNDAPPAQTNPPTPPVEGTATDALKEPPVPTRDENGKFAKAPAAPPDPVAAAIAKLTGDKPAQPAAPKAPEAPKAAGAPPGPAVDNLTSDPLHDFNDAQKAALRGKTHERVQELHGRWRASERRYEEIAPYVESAKEFQGIVQEHGVAQDIGYVAPDHLATDIKHRAAINRSLLALQNGRQPSAQDLGLVQAFGAQADQLRQRLGIQAPAAAPAPLQPFQGELPRELQELITVYDLPEADVRLLAAARGLKAPAAAAPPAPAPAAVPPSAPPAPQQADPAAQSDALYARRLVAELAGQGVTDAHGRVAELLRSPATQREVLRRFPGLTAEEVPRVFDTVFDARERYDVLMSVHRMLTKPASPPAQTLPKATNNPDPRGSGLRPPAPAASTDPVAAAIARLTRSE